MEKREKTIIGTSVVGIGANVLLVVFKTIIGLIANSVSIITDAINNLTDALSSVITIVGTKIANKKADKKHPFGHGRVEYLTSIIIAALIFFAGGSAITESINSLINGEVPSYDTYALVIISVAVVMKIGLGIFFKIQGKKTNSQALSASGTDALFDAILSTGTLVAAIIAITTDVYIEGYIGIAIGLFIIKSGIEVILEAFSSIIGKRTDFELASKIKEDVKSIPGVLGAYDLFLNEYGPEKMVGSIHIEVNDNLSAREIADLTLKVSSLIYAKYKIALTVGIYSSNDDDESRKIKEAVQEIIKDYPTVLELHGFYVDNENKLVKFDLVISFDEKDKYGLINEVTKKIKEQYSEYKYIINIDEDITTSDLD